MKAIVILAGVCLSIPIMFLSEEAILQNLILYLTALTIFWYTYETYLLRRLTVDSNFVENQPFIYILGDSVSTTKDQLNVSNKGKGLALNIKIDVDYITGTNESLQLGVLAAGESFDISDMLAVKSNIIDTIKFYCTDIANKSYEFEYSQSEDDDIENPIHVFTWIRLRPIGATNGSSVHYNSISGSLALGPSDSNGNKKLDKCLSTQYYYEEPMYRLKVNGLIGLIVATEKKIELAQEVEYGTIRNNRLWS